MPVFTLSIRKNTELYVCTLAFEIKSNLYFLLGVSNIPSEFDDVRQTVSVFDDETVLHMRPLALTFES